MAGRSQKGKEKVHYVASTTFTIDRKYADLKLVGKGSYGVVCSAVDTDTGNKIAIKKITPMAKDIMDAKHVLREIRLMRHMGKHENIISLEDIMIREAADELYIVMELLDSDLHRVIQSPQILTASHHRHFIHQLLCGVKYLHDNRIIHRDLKPGNLLVTRDCRLRITDFGLARERPTGHGSDPDDNIDEPMTEHVVTRWYRPPELMLCPDGLYTYAVDMWSVGCILAEMMARRPIFPGKNFIDQLTLIFDVIGSPQPDEVSHIQNSQAKKYLASQKGKRTIPAERIFPESSRDFHDILNGLLVFEPRKRLTVDECLRAHLFANVSPSASSVYPPVSSSFEFSFEKSKTTKDKLKQLIVGEGVSIQRENLARKRLLAKRENGSNDSRQDIDGPADDDDDRSRASNSTAGRSLGTTRTDGTTKPSQKPTAVPRYATTTATRGYAQPRHASTGRSGMRRTGGDVAGPPGKISTGSRGNLGATAGLSAGAESQRKTESNMRDRRTSDPTARRGTDATDASNGYPPPPVLPTRPSNHPAAGGVAATVTTAATNAKAGQEDMYGSPVRRKPVVVKQAVSPSSPLGASEYPIVAMDSPSRRNKGAMRELEDAECSNKAMQYMSKMSALSPSRNPGKKKGSSGVGIAHEEEKYDSGRVTAVKASSGTATSVGIGVEDDDDLIVRMKRLYGISIHDSKHTGVSSTQATCQIPAPAVTGSNVRVIARRTENTPDSPPPARGVSASEPPVGYHCNTYDSDPDEEEDDDEYDLQAARRLLASNTTRPTSAVRPSVPVLASGKRMDSDSRPLVGSKHIDDYDVSEDNGMDRSLNRAVGSTAQAKDEPSRNAPATATLSAATGVGAGAKELAHSGVVTSGYRSTAAAAARFGGNDDDDDSDDGEDNDDLTGGGYREAEAKSKAAGVCEREKTMPGQSTHTTSTGKTHRVKRKDLEDKPWRVNSTLMYNSGSGRGGNEEQTRTRQRDVESQGLDAVAAVRNMYMVSGRHTSIGEAGQDDDSDKQVIGDMRGERREKTQQAGASQSQVPGKKGLTVPKSPQFSKMSWQRRRHGRGHEGEPPGIPPAATGTYHQHQQQGQMKRKKSEEQLGGTARAGSAPRGKKISTMEHSAVGGGDGGVATSHRGGAAGGGRVDKRSASSGRMGGSSSRAGLY